MPSFGRGSKIICPMLVIRTTKRSKRSKGAVKKVNYGTIKKEKYEQSITTQGMSRNNSQAANINPFYTPNNVQLRTKQLVRNSTQEQAYILRELCKTIVIKKDVKMKLKKPQKGINLAK
jgi:hypothetical protein